MIRVIDEGPGIDAKSLPRIFAPLEQGETLDHGPIRGWVSDSRSRGCRLERWTGT